MKRLLTLALTLALGAAASLALAAPAHAHHDEFEANTGEEAALIQCIFYNDRDLARSIRDAADEHEFLARLERGAALCKTSVKDLSLSRLFQELNALIPQKSASVNRGSK